MEMLAQIMPMSFFLERRTLKSLVRLSTQRVERKLLELPFLHLMELEKIG